MTHKTALDLKLSGFPQGSGGFGEKWFIDGVLCFKFRETAITESGAVIYEFGEMVYCPTAEDLILKLGDGWVLGWLDDEFVCAHEMGDEYSHEDMVESLSLAYLNKDQ